MAEVVWADQAIADVVDIVAWIAPERPWAAARLAERLLQAGNALAQFSARGRSISQNRRELTVVAPYLIRYRVTADGVRILEVRHAAREPD